MRKSSKSLSENVSTVTARVYSVLFVGVCGKVLLTDTGHYHCPKTERIHLTGEHRSTGVWGSCKLALYFNFNSCPSSFTVKYEALCEDEVYRVSHTEVHTGNTNVAADACALLQRIYPVFTWDASLAPFKSSAHGSVDTQAANLPPTPTHSLRKLFYSKQVRRLAESPGL